MPVSPQNAVTMAAAETRLVVDSLVGDHLLHFIHSFSTLDTEVLHHCSRSNLSIDTRPDQVVKVNSPHCRIAVLVLGLVCCIGLCH